MKRDALPTPDPAAPSPQVAHRHSRAMLEAALLALQMREYTIAELGEYLAAQMPSQHLDMVRLVERLVERGEIEIEGELLGLTDDGDTAAARIRDRPAPRISKTPATEIERRIQALAVSLRAQTHLLTAGQRHNAASAADLAPPPMRPGTQAALDLPSRIDNCLHYRDGRVTTMDGSEVQAAHREANYVPSRNSRNLAERMGYPDKLFAR